MAFMCYNMDRRQVQVISKLEDVKLPYLPYVPLYAELPSLHIWHHYETMSDYIRNGSMIGVNDSCYGTTVLLCMLEATISAICAIVCRVTTIAQLTSLWDYRCLYKKWIRNKSKCFMLRNNVLVMYAWSGLSFPGWCMHDPLWIEHSWFLWIGYPCTKLSVFYTCFCVDMVLDNYLCIQLSSLVFMLGGHLVQ